MSTSINARNRIASEVRRARPRPRDFIFGTDSNSESFADSSSTIFSIYLSHAEKHDKSVTESWKAGADGTLVFTGLFAAAVASFVIDSYKSLLPDSAGDTVKLLAQISQQLDGLSNGTRASIESSIPPPPVFNHQLLPSCLVTSLFCALLATLQQRWARQYLNVTQPHVATHKRARIRSYFAEGAARFHIAVAVEAIPGLLHVSVFLFLAGLAISAFNIHHTVAYVVLAATIVCTLAYLMITVLPAIYHDSPYSSPFSAPTWIISQKIAIGLHYTVDHIVAFFRTRFVRNRKTRLELDEAPTVTMRQFEDMITAAHDAAANSSWEIDARALGWTLDKLDEPRQLIPFAAGIPGFSCSTEAAPRQSALHRKLYQRIVFLLMRASDIKLLRCSQLVSESERQRCRQICLKALYCLPDAIKHLLRPDKVEAGFKPIFHSAESWVMAETLSQPDKRVHRDVAIGAQCVAAVQATQRPDAETQPILERQLKLEDKHFDNLLLKNLNNFLENTAIKFTELREEPKKLEDNDMILSTVRLLVKRINDEEKPAKDVQSAQEQIAKDEKKQLWEKIKIRSENPDQASRICSENAKKLLESLQNHPRSPPLPTLSNPSPPRSRNTYIEMPLLQPATPMSPSISV
ncbi:hypothetical protein BC827DRAFT_1234983 [Russula dissimulans]|nr:hypothetical protein BC827DRAFT_1234983 [Russula dissimulans]